MENNEIWKVIVIATPIALFLLIAGIIFLYRKRRPFPASRTFPIFIPPSPYSHLSFYIPGLEVFQRKEKLYIITHAVMTALDPYLFTLFWHLAKLQRRLAEPAAKHRLSRHDSAGLETILDGMEPTLSLVLSISERKITGREEFFSHDPELMGLDHFSPTSLYEELWGNGLSTVIQFFKGFEENNNLIGAKSDTFVESFEFLGTPRIEKHHNIIRYGSVVVFIPFSRGSRRKFTDIAELLYDSYFMDSPVKMASLPHCKGGAPSVVYIDLVFYYKFSKGLKLHPDGDLSFYGEKFVLKSATAEDPDTDASYLIARRHPQDGSPRNLPFPDRIVIKKDELGPWVKCDPKPEKMEKRVTLLQDSPESHNVRMLQYVAIK